MLQLDANFDPVSIENGRRKKKADIRLEASLSCKPSHLQIRLGTRPRICQASLSLGQFPRGVRHRLAADGKLHSVMHRQRAAHRHASQCLRWLDLFDWSGTCKECPLRTP